MEYDESESREQATQVLSMFVRKTSRILRAVPFDPSENWQISRIHEQFLVKYLF